MTSVSILIVEDERIIAKGIEKRLKGLGYDVAGLVSTGEEAVQKAAELRPDLILMDIRLGPGMDGVEAANLIRTRFHVPVVYLTAHSDNATLQRAKVTEPFGYILKPYEDKDLQTAIEIGLYKFKMERRLRENEQWLATTLASIGDGVLATDESGRVRFMNSVAEGLTGWAQADALDRDVREVFHIVNEQTRRLVSNPVQGALATGYPATMPPDTILIGKAGREFPIEDIAAPIRDAHGRVSGAVLVFRDITERRRLETHLRQAQKMEALGQLAGGIAHDFNNIVTTITGYSELLLSSGQPPSVQDQLHYIHEAGMRAASLTKQILAFSRKQILAPCALNLNSVVRDTSTMVKCLIGSDIEFVVETAPDLGHVKADPTQIGQVIVNLAVNARDAMPTGGRLIVATANAELGEPTSRQLPDVTPGRYAMLSVSDTGSGMTKDVLAHLFEPFFTTKEAGQGTGLGLSTVYGIVKQSGGHIEVSSEVGRGTTFRVYLPLIEEPASKPDSQARRPAAKGHETILLVDDEESVRRLAATVLRQNGYRVLEASNGLEGVQVAESHRETIHLLLTDLVMPKLSGREMAERLRPLKPGLRVLFMSGYAEGRVAQQGVESSTVDFLHKPFSIADLTQKVREILDRE